MVALAIEEQLECCQYLDKRATPVILRALLEECVGHTDECALERSIHVCSSEKPMIQKCDCGFTERENRKATTTNET